MNAISVIAPYKHHGKWVFDDPRVGLLQEPFVAGADTMIDRVVADITDAEHGYCRRTSRRIRESSAAHRLRFEGGQISNASVMMVESAQDRAGSDGADALNWTPERRVLVQRPVGSDFRSKQHPFVQSSQANSKNLPDARCLWVGHLCTGVVQQGWPSCARLSRGVSVSCRPRATGA
jgi:hypothetical protein